MIAASNRKALDACYIGPGRSVQIQDSPIDLSFAGLAPFSIEAHFYIEPCSEPIVPPGHQQGPAQWHGHQVLLSKFNGCVSGEYRLGLDAQRRPIFQREVEPWIVTGPDPVPANEWHSVVATYDGATMRLYLDSRLVASVKCGEQKADEITPVVLGADLCGYATAHHFEGYLSEVSIWRRCLGDSDVQLLAQHGPTGHSALAQELVAYWCIYRRADGGGRGPVGAGRGAAGQPVQEMPGSVVYNDAPGVGRYHGRVVSEGGWAMGRFKTWLRSGCSSRVIDEDDGGAHGASAAAESGGVVDPPGALPSPRKDRGGDAGAASTTGVLFSAAARSHMLICGSATALSFGERRPYSIAVQFYPRGPAGGARQRLEPHHPLSALRAESRPEGSEQVLISKYNRGFRGEYRLGLDASGRVFASREAPPWVLVAEEPVATNRWHSATVTYDGLELRLYVNYKLCASTPSGTQFSDEVTPVHVGCDVSRDTFTNHFEGFISEACIWNRALPHAEVQALSAESPLRGGTLERGLLGAWRFLESGDLALQEAGRVIIPNDAFSPRGRPPRPLSWPASNGTSLGAWPHGPSSDDVATPPRDPSDGMDGIGPAQAMHGVLKTLSHMHPIGLTLRPGVQAVLVELGAVGHDLSRHWVQALSRIGVQAMRSGTRAAGGAQASRSNDRKAGPQSQLANGAATTSAVVAAAEAANAVASGILAPAADDLERRYCYMGMSVALQKNLTQALDLHANEVLVHRVASGHHSASDDAAVRRLHAEYRQKLVDVRGRAWQLFRDWFFENPVNALRECDGDRCEFWRFRYPWRRVRACQVVVEEARARFPQDRCCPLVLASFGSGLLFQDFCTVQMLLDAGFSHIRLVLVDTAYRAWRLKYLRRDSSCRAFVVPSSQLSPELLRPDPVTPGPADNEETINNAAIAAVNNAISFVLYNDALHQFSQWFTAIPEGSVQLLLYDSVDAYISDCAMAPDEVRCHICSAMDYKDNETLLESAVNHMMTNCLLPNGIGVKLVTMPNETLPGVYVVNRQLQTLWHELLGHG